MSSIRNAAGQCVLRIVVGAMVASVLLLPIGVAGTDLARAADGISTDNVAAISTIDDGGQFVVLRVVIEPGVSIAQNRFPGSSLFVVISGTLQTTLVRGGAAVSRGANEQEAEIGATMNLSAGQVISYSPGAVMTMANLRHERLVLLVTMLLDPNESVDTYEGLFVLGEPDLQ